MGVSYYGMVVYGVPTIQERRNKTVTRYHEVTGEPYQKTVNDYVTVFVGHGIEFPDVPDDAWDDFCDAEILFNTESVGYFGIKVASVDPNYGDIVPLFFDMEALRKEFAEAVNKLTDDEDMHAFLIANASLYLIGTAH